MKDILSFLLAFFFVGAALADSTGPLVYHWEGSCVHRFRVCENLRLLILSSEHEKCVQMKTDCVAGCKAAYTACQKSGSHTEAVCALSWQGCLGEDPLKSEPPSHAARSVASSVSTSAAPAATTDATSCIANREECLNDDTGLYHRQKCSSDYEKCSGDCLDDYNDCRKEENANMESCVGEYAQCLGENPFPTSADLSSTGAGASYEVDPDEEDDSGDDDDDDDDDPEDEDKPSDTIKRAASHPTAANATVTEMATSFTTYCSTGTTSTSVSTPVSHQPAATSSSSNDTTSASGSIVATATSSTLAYTGAANKLAFGGAAGIIAAAAFAL